MNRPRIAGLLAMLLSTLAVILNDYPAHAQGSATLPYPGQTALVPFGRVTFVQPSAAGLAPPAAPLHLTVVSTSDQTTTVAFNGMQLTVNAPAGWSVRFVTGCSGASGNPAHCPRQACGQECVAQPERGIVGFTTLPAAPPQAGSTGGPPPLFHPYVAGWNLVGISEEEGPPPTSASLYRLLPDGSGYEAIAPADALPGVGYWAYFAHDTHGIVPPHGPCERLMPSPSDPGLEICVPAFPPIPLPAGQWMMVGNPYTSPVAVLGADAVEVYDPTSGDYYATTVLTPGEGAFAYSTGGGELSFGLPPPPT